jgi:hypothetical protein
MEHWKLARQNGEALGREGWHDGIPNAQEE